MKKIGHFEELAKRIEKDMEIETNTTVLGNMQRGRSLICKDEFYLSIMGIYAI